MLLISGSQYQMSIMSFTDKYPVLNSSDIENLRALLAVAVDPVSLYTCACTRIWTNMVVTII